MEGRGLWWEVLLKKRRGGFGIALITGTGLEQPLSHSDVKDLHTWAEYNLTCPVSMGHPWVV